MNLLTDNKHRKGLCCSRAFHLTCLNKVAKYQNFDKPSKKVKVLIVFKFFNLNLSNNNKGFNMSLFRVWAKAGAIKTIESLGVSLSESRVIVDSVHTALFDEMRKLIKKLNNQQRNILLAKYCLIFYQEKYNNYQHLITIQNAATGFRFQIYNNFDLDYLKIADVSLMISIQKYLNNEIENLSEQDMVNVFNYQDLKDEFSYLKDEFS